MRVLWLTGSNTLEKRSKSGDSYNGGGWVASLHRLLVQREGISLGVAYLSHDEKKAFKIDETAYYPIQIKALSKFEKLWRYYGGYKKIDDNAYVEQIQDVINIFHPDVVHLFGIENPMATILGRTEVPVVVHLQGLLGPCDTAFFPQGFNKWTLLYPFSKQEWIIRNGNIFAKNDIHVKGIYEKRLFEKMEFCMGRTKWDFQVSRLMSPKSNYYHVDEVLRESFYKYAGMWVNQKRGKFIVISTLSETMYKGLDLILKTARLLKQETRVPFEWHVVGINSDSRFIKQFEYVTEIESSEVSIKYLGVLDEEVLCERLLESNVFVHPSYIDNSSNSVCEAQMLGMPVIATYVGGLPSLIDNGIDGILVPANAPYELAYILKKMNASREEMSKMGQCAYNTALRRHDKEKIINDLIHTYHSVISNSIS